MKHLRVALGLLSLAAIVPALAGPFEDGQDAYSKKDFVGAAKLYAQAATAGDSRGQTMLGIMYVTGDGIPADVKQGLQWLSVASKSGNSVATDLLGDIYAAGTGVSQDWSIAQQYYLAAAQGGNAPAEKSLGDIYYYGRGSFPQDYDKAGQLYLLAAKQNNGSAEYLLGWMNYFGNGMPINYAQAVSWFSLSAAQGDAGGQLFLGISYDFGRGVPQDYAQAIEEYTKAARQGNTTAFGLLGEKYYNGQGTPRDPMRAYIFLNISAASQDSADMQKSMADERDGAAAKLTSEQLASAQAIVRRCVASFDACEALPVDPSTNATAVVTAQPSSAGELYATGSGFYINGQGQLITNAHVIEGCATLKLSTGLVLKELAIDSDSDLALLASGQKAASFAKLRGGKGDQLGESVVAVGFPLPGILTTDPIVSTGTISALAGMQNDRRNIQISAPVQPGNSGGPLIGEDGAIVGVVSAKLDAIRVAGANNDIPQNVNFAVSVATLQSFLNSHGVVYVNGPPTGPKMSSAAIAAEGARYSVRIECWK